MLLKAHFVRSFVRSIALISFISRPQNSHLSRCFWDEKEGREVTHLPGSEKELQVERFLKLLIFPQQSPNLASNSRRMLRWPPAHSAGRPTDGRTDGRTDRPKTRIFGRRPSSLASSARPGFQNCRSRPCRPHFHGLFFPVTLSAPLLLLGH